MSAGAADDFKYTPHMSEADFDNLTTAEKHQLAAAELADGTVPFADDWAAIDYGRDYWNDYVHDLDPSAKQALRDYTGDTFPSYKDMNGYLRGTPPTAPDLRSCTTSARWTGSCRLGLSRKTSWSYAARASGTSTSTRRWK